MPMTESILSVGEYLAHLNDVLAVQHGRIKGEVGKVQHSQKAVYFTIKDIDETALLECMIWQSTYRLLGLELAEGAEVIVTGVPNVYAPWGSFKFKANVIEYAGEGALKRDYEKLKKALATEGLFADERKRALPKFPRKIGIITSLRGDAIHDFRNNLGRRGYKLSAVDSRVEGKAAVIEIIAAMKTMSAQDIDVLVIARGGGSWESLQAFNSESVVRAVTAFKVPVLTGIGHHEDVTLTELVADLGASTPTGAARALNESWEGLESAVRLLSNRSVTSFASWLHAAQNDVTGDGQQIQQVFRNDIMQMRHNIQNQTHMTTTAFARLAARIHQAGNSLRKASGLMRANLQAIHEYLESASVQLGQQYRASLQRTHGHLVLDFMRGVRRQAETLRLITSTIDMFERELRVKDPARNIRLGYSLSYANGKLVRSVHDLKAGATVTTRLADGKFTSDVKEVQ
jgi:exodeoxyribonuclease VII large subunit